YVDTEDRRQHARQRRPVLAAIVADIDLAAGSAEIHPERIEPVGVEAVAQYRHVTMRLRQAAGHCLPAVAAVLAAINAQLAVHGAAELAGFLWNREQRVRRARVQSQRITEIAGQAGADFLPGFARVIRAPDASMAVAIQATLRMQPQCVVIMPGHWRCARQIRRTHAGIAWLPAGAAIQRTINAARRHGQEDALRIGGIDHQRMHHAAALGRMPQRAGGMAVKALQALPARAAIVADEQPGRFNASINRVRLRVCARGQAPDGFQILGTVIKTVARYFSEWIPAAPAIAAAINVDAPDRMMGRSVAGAPVARVDEGALDLVTGQMRALE